MATRLEAALERVDEQITQEASTRRAPFTEEFLEEIRQTDMMSVVGEYVTKPFGRGRMVNCPFHDDKNPSMQVHDDHAHCFGCHWHGDQIKFVMDIDHVSFRQAVTRIAAIAGLPLAFAGPEEQEELQRRRAEQEILRERLEALRWDARVRMPEILNHAADLRWRMPEPLNGEMLLALTRLEMAALEFVFGGGVEEYVRMVQAEQELFFWIDAAQWVMEKDDHYGLAVRTEPPRHQMFDYYWVFGDPD